MNCRSTHGTNTSLIFCLHIASRFRSPPGKAPFTSYNYGRDPRLPTKTVLCAPAGLYPTDIGDYRNELTTKLASAWANAKKEIEGAQAAQKCQYDRAAKDCAVETGLWYVCPVKSKARTGSSHVLTMAHIGSSTSRLRMPKLSWLTIHEICLYSCR